MAVSFPIPALPPACITLNITVPTQLKQGNYTDYWISLSSTHFKKYSGSAAYLLIISLFSIMTINTDESTRG